MLDDEILQGFLDKASAKAMQEIRDKGKLSEENAIPLMLKSQFNHIAHLEIELSDIRKNMVTKDQFEGLKDQFTGLKDQFTGLKDQFGGLKDQFGGLKDQFNFVKWVIMLGFTVIGALQIYTAFLR